ncbi:DUF6223 family protein [Actinoplanes sp. NPDC023801]|uniref:DUF6223 family protein n=1 Tax=Actinoplanes sp. NPDC023801 TaxID=3154595 RepID=UPI0033C08142
MGAVHIPACEGNTMLDLRYFAESAVGASTMTSDRAVATASAIVALAGAVLGGLALLRPTGGNPRRAVAALGAGLLGAVAGVWVLATADGGPGTGNGVVGGYAGVAFGLIAVLLAGLALTRSRTRTGARTRM